VKQHRFQVLLQENAGMAELESFLFNAVITKMSDSEMKGCLVVNTAGEIGNKDADIVSEVNQYYDFIRNMLKKVLLNAIAKTEIPENTNVEEQANFFLGVMQGVSVASKTMNNNQLNDFISVALKQIK
jgi:TetR/AcrR family transcriptional repressor of nem operon